MPASWDTLYGYLVEQKHYPVELVEKAGLLVPRKGGGGYYDRFRDRLMIPILDLQSRVIGFGGRALGDDQPKYLNSPETELFDKGKTLFGLDKARAAIAKQDQALVVEGYFDVITLHSAGIENAVAALGTARLVKANLTNAILEGTYAFNAKFAGATIEGADFTDALLRDDEIEHLCEVASGVNPTTGRATRESLMCP